MAGRPFLAALGLVIFCLFHGIRADSEDVETTTRKIVDADSQEDLWNEIRWKYIQINVSINEKREVNQAPLIGKYLKVVATSDTHDNLDKIFDGIPDGDVFVFAGDLSNYGQTEEIEEFNRLVSLLPHKHKLIIAGNHELGFDSTEDQSLRKAKYQGKGTAEGYKLITNATYIIDQTVTIDGVVFYGAPWHPLKGFPFYRPRDVIGEEWEKMPPKVDVVITHTPPLGYNDLYPPVERWGDYALLQKINKLRPAFHVYGHCHYAPGALWDGRTTFINVASKDGSSDNYRKPYVFYIPTRTHLFH